MTPRTLLVALTFVIGITALGADSPTAPLDGTWTSKSKARGAEVVTVMVIDNGKFTHRVTAGGQLQFHSEGKVALEEMKPFKVLAFTGVIWGHSEAEKLDLGEDRRSTYLLHDGKLHMASNFEKLRQDEAPRIDVFSK